MRKTPRPAIRGAFAMGRFAIAATIAAASSLGLHHARATEGGAPQCYRAELTGEGIHLREGPRVSAPSRALGRRGERFRVRSADGDWAEILDGAHRGRFVHQRFLSLEFATDLKGCAQAQGPAEVRGDRVNVRNAPQLDAPAAGQAYRGDPLTIMPASGPWMKILWPETWQDRYIHRDFVSLVLPAR